MKIYLALDWKCLSDEKIAAGRVGGTERFFLIVARWLREAGHIVWMNPDPEKSGIEQFDVAIHSNSYQNEVNARFHVCWAGSWHTDAAMGPYDLVMLNSSHMYGRLGCKQAHIVPACFEAQIPEYHTDAFIPHRIVTTSNPNRYLLHAEAICKALDKTGINYEWHFCGGNKLYTEAWGEGFSGTTHPKLFYHGVLTRQDALLLLTSGHVFVYPNLSDDSETQCVAPIEAVVLGLPAVLPNREPFTTTMQSDAVYCDTTEQFVSWILKLFEMKTRFRRDVSRFSEAVIMPRFIDLIKSLVKGG